MLPPVATDDYDTYNRLADKCSQLLLKPTPSTASTLWSTEHCELVQTKLGGKGSDIVRKRETARRAAEAAQGLCLQTLPHWSVNSVYAENGLRSSPKRLRVTKLHVETFHASNAHADANKNSNCFLAQQKLYKFVVTGAHST